MGEAVVPVLALAGEDGFPHHGQINYVSNTVDATTGTIEIRGAGDLLGPEQSGHVAALGFELYVELLNEAVAELQGQRRIAARRA